MRLTTLALAALIAAGCGGDEADDTESLPTQRPVPEQPAADTTIGDTIAAAMDSGEVAGRPGQPGQPGQAGQPERAGAVAGETGRTGGGQPGQSPRLYTVQVAAFTEAASATEWADRLRRQGMPVWTSVAELGGQTFHRLRVGAVPTVAEARRLGSMLTSRYEWPVWVAPMTPADRPPENAVDASRRLIESG